MSSSKSGSSGQRVGRVARLFGSTYLRLFGWRVDGALSPRGKAVLIAAPHTSNWDLPFMLAAAWVLGVHPSWLGKREIFRRPFGGIMCWLGGIAVDRNGPGDMVRQVAERFAAAESLYVVIPPSATRSCGPHWKSGFYHVARAARVPIVCSYLDYRRKVAGIGPTLLPTGDLRPDMDTIRAFYEPIIAKFPEHGTPVRLREEMAGEERPERKVV